jgi:hypothetical protein
LLFIPGGIVDCFNFPLARRFILLDHHPRYGCLLFPAKAKLSADQGGYWEAVGGVLSVDQVTATSRNINHLGLDFAKFKQGLSRKTLIWNTALNLLHAGGRG